MTAQSITTDQTVLDLFDNATSITGIGGGQGASVEPDFFIQGTESWSRRISGTGAVGGFGVVGTVSLGTAEHAYVWALNITPGLSQSITTGGQFVAIGASGNAYDQYYVNGSEGTVGGWICYPVDPTLTADATVGNRAGSNNFMGGGLTTTSNTNRPNLGVDAIRYGTGIDSSGGGTPDPNLDFDSVATQNDLTANQWGILAAQSGGFSLQGELRIGIDDASSPSTWSDTDAVLTKPNNNPAGVNQKTATNFSGITLRGGGTTATFTGCLFISLDATDRGFLDCDTATNAVSSGTFTGCTFIDWGAIGGRSTVLFDETQFKNCAGMILNQSQVTDSSFQACDPVDVGTNIDLISGTSFISGGTGHAITTSVDTGSLSFVGNTFSGYGANTTADSAINFTATTGTVDLNISGGGNTPTFTSAGVTVNINISSTLTFTGLEDNTEVRVYDAGTTTEVAGVENSLGGTFAASISVASVDVNIHNLNYQFIRFTGLNTSSDLTVPVQQVFDRQYENP